MRASLLRWWESAKTFAVSAVDATTRALRKGQALAKAFASRAVEAVKWASVQTARSLLFVPLVLWRGLAVIFLALATIAPVALPISVLAALAISPEIFQSLKEILGLPLQVTAVVLALGILGNLFVRVIDHGWNELKCIFRRAWKALRDGPWKPCWEIRESVRITREYVLAKVRRNFKRSVKSSWRLMGWLAVGMLLASLAYPPTSPPPKHHVVVVNSTDANQEVVADVVKVYMRAGAVFSLTHAANAEPQTGAGICLNDDQKHWLGIYRAAIVECLRLEKEHGFERESPPVFKVTAFASIAPASSNGNTDKETSALTNCEIANRRAEAVGAFLANKDEEKWGCDGVAEGIRTTDELCPKRGDVEKEKIRHLYERDDGLNFEILVSQWGEPESMMENKPVNDGKVPEDRRYRIEMFNRSVYIAVEDDFCRAYAEGKTDADGD